MTTFTMIVFKARMDGFICLTECVDCISVCYTCVLSFGIYLREDSQINISLLSSLNL